MKSPQIILGGTTGTSSSQVRHYNKSECIAFLKTKDNFGGLSNMAGGFPLDVNGVKIRTSEALYQACRFPANEEAQKAIIAQFSPMTAKAKSVDFMHYSRPDWMSIRVKVMRWCLRVKLSQNWHSFGDILMDTGDLPIVEISLKDDFWGAKPTATMFAGKNVLGRLLMELREDVALNGQVNFLAVEPLIIEDFLLFNIPINTVFPIKK